MCDQEYCFRFEEFRYKSAAVFVSGPGNLEYQWALETALRLHENGAEVFLYDLSLFSLRYSARIRIKKYYLPYLTRSLLRSTLLMKKLRVENAVRDICSSNGISFYRPKPQKRIFFPHPIKRVKLQEFDTVNWGPVDAKEILRTFFSSRSKKVISDLESIPLQVGLNLKASINSVVEFMESFEIRKFDSYFLANGRQGVSATITKILRGRDCNVLLYESSGGYIFPEKLDARLDYWQSSPADPSETQKKVMCKDLTSKINYEIVSRVKSMIRDRSQVAFTLNYLTSSPSSVDNIALSNHRNYSFFATTDWEISVLYEKPQNPKLFLTQLEAVKCILDNIDDKDRLFIRLHPNDPNIKSGLEDVWKQFENDKRVVLIHPEDRTDSYELAKLMDANFVWTSFLGIELALRQIPVGVMGDASYALTIRDFLVDDCSKVSKFLKDPYVLDSNSLDQYISYLIFGGFKIESSKSYSDRKIFIAGKQVDVFKSWLNWVPESVRTKIS